eukprot:scaffold244469_cov18-Prasinocladus_malaysianus.AAC.1
MLWFSYGCVVMIRPPLAYSIGLVQAAGKWCSKGPTMEAPKSDPMTCFGIAKNHQTTHTVWVLLMMVIATGMTCRHRNINGLMAIFSSSKTMRVANSYDN